MSRAENQPVHPEDKKYKRREVLQKGLQYTAKAGYAVVAIASGDMALQTVDAAIKSKQLEKTYPTPSIEELEEAQEIKEEQARYNDLPKRKTEWADQKISQDEAHDKEYRRRYPNVFSRFPIDIKVGGVGSGVAVGSSIAEKVVGRKSKRELSRRELFRYIYPPYNEPDTK